MRYLFLLLTACNVDTLGPTCGPDNELCCLDDDQCVDAWGLRFPYCHGAEVHGIGTCSECLVGYDSTCQRQEEYTETCAPVESGPAVCIRS